VSWSVPRIWDGKTIAVLATGPSLTAEAVEKVRRLPCIAVNDAYRLAPWAEILFAMDSRWWRHNDAAVAVFAGIKVSLALEDPVAGVHTIKRSGEIGFDVRPNRIRTGGNSGYGAVHIAIQTGAARVLLLGFDMHGDHFFGKHPAPLRNPKASKFAKWIGRFGALNGRGAQIVNCTPGSRLNAFPHVRLDDEVTQ